MKIERKSLQSSKKDKMMNAFAHFAQESVLLIFAPFI